MNEYQLRELLSYEQPSKYIVKSTEYNDSYPTPVLTAGKSFILGYTNEIDDIFDELPVIIFDDFTTATQYVDFKFKVKSSAMKILHINQELVLPKYIFYRLQTINIDHSTHKRYWIQQYSKIKISIPTIHEQEKIVKQIEESLSQLDSAVATLKKTKQQLDIYRQAVLKEAFSTIDKYVSVKEKSVLVTSGSRGWAKYYSENGSKFIRIGNLNRRNIDIDLSEIQHLALPEKAEGTRSKLETGDILISITADLGSIGLVPENIGEAYINQHIALLRLKNKKQSKFIALYFRCDIGQKQLLKNKRGAGKLGLGLDDIRNSLIPNVTDDIADRIVNRIEEKLSVCSNIETSINQSLQQAEALRQSILKQAFEEDYEKE